MRVQIYSTQTCHYCKIAKDFFAQSGVSFEEHDVYSDLDKRMEMMHKSGQMGVPVIDIDGEIIIGFNKSKIAKILNVSE